MSIASLKARVEGEKGRKLFFFSLIILSFLAIYLYNLFTPAMTDDLSYAKIVEGANSFLDLLRQEKHQYMTWTGRSVNHMILRSFLSFDKGIFNLANSLAFTGLGLLIYLNIENRRKYDPFIFLLIQLFLWLFGVSFEQTVLWETGACNYLWGSTLIMAFITSFRFMLKREEAGGKGKKPSIGSSVGILLLGILAGWCNENTSGGGILLILIWILFYVRKNHRVKLWMVLGLAGSLTGFAFMLLAPGNANRMQFMEEEHTGLLALVSRWLKCNLAIRNHFLILLSIGIVAFIIVRLQKSAWIKSKNMLIFFFVFLATCYALVLTPEPVARAYFGAGIFLIISVIQGIVDVEDRDLYVRALKLGSISVLTLYFVFLYLECGAHLMRIYRESNERFAYIEEQKAAGNMDITVPMLRPAFQNRYSDAYNSELSEDSEYWVNVAYATYYGVEKITALPREEWEEQFQD